MILRLLSILLTLAVMGPVPVLANVLTLPARARQLANRINPLDSYALPLGPLESGELPTHVFEGRVERQSWRLNGAVDSTLQVLDPLRGQLRSAGFDVLFDCRDLDCGGFDFRFATEVIPAPDMHVNVRDYRFLAAMRGDNEALSLLVSRIGNSIYIQVVHVSPTEQASSGGGQTGKEISRQSPPQTTSGLMGNLESQGHVTLGDLDFETGAGRLGKGPFSSLGLLAVFLKLNPGYRIALVGHTDSVGSLDVNIALSRKRAASVRERLTRKYGIEPERVDAEGMGYLAPVATNLTREGREANRRVEAILLSQ